MAEDPTKVRKRFRIALDLFETGEAIMRQNLRRRFPTESPEEIEQRLDAWLQNRPGADLGDAPGEGHIAATHDQT